MVDIDIIDEDFFRLIENIYVSRYEWGECLVIEDFYSIDIYKSNEN